MSGWEDSPPGRELPPGAVGSDEDGDRISPPAIDLAVAKTVNKTWRDLRRLKPHLYVVFKAWAELFQLRDQDTQYTHGLYRGFYAEMSRKLGVTEPAVKNRLARAKLWFASRIERGRSLSTREAPGRETPA